MIKSTHCESTGDKSANSAFEFEIPRFSTTASQIVEELGKDDACVATAIRLIECEPTISSLILRLANSPIYGASREITTIGHAIVVLGFRCVAQQAIAAASGTLFKTGDASLSDHREKTYIQSLGVATAARLLSDQLGMGNPDEAFLCGVVHDVGKLVLFEHDGAEYTRMLEELSHEECLQSEVERYGVTHTTIGRQCGVAWSLPHKMCNSIEDHHGSLSEVEDPLSKTLICALYYAMKWQLGFLEEDFAINPDLESELGEFETEELIAKCREDFQAICEICL